MEEFSSFQTPDEVEEQTKKKTISDLIKPTTKSPEVVKVESKEKEIKVPSEVNPYPRIFKDYYSYSVFKKLYDELVGIQNGDVEAPEGWIKVIEE